MIRLFFKLKESLTYELLLALTIFGITECEFSNLSPRSESNSKGWYFRKLTRYEFELKFIVTWETRPTIDPYPNVPVHKFSHNQSSSNQFKTGKMHEWNFFSVKNVILRIKQKQDCHIVPYRARHGAHFFLFFGAQIFFMCAPCALCFFFNLTMLNLSQN